MDERRRYKRFNVLHRLKIQKKGSSVYHIIIRDISQGGMRIKSDEFLAPQSQIKIFVNPEHLKKVGGKVIWTRKLPQAEAFESGLEFLNIDSFSRKELILRFLSLQGV